VAWLPLLAQWRGSRRHLSAHNGGCGRGVAPADGNSPAGRLGGALGLPVGWSVPPGRLSQRQAQRAVNDSCGNASTVEPILVSNQRGVTFLSGPAANAH
jgi:hypothetical protein